MQLTIQVTHCVDCVLTFSCQNQNRVRTVCWRVVALCSHSAGIYRWWGISSPEGPVQLHHVRRVSAVMTDGGVSDAYTGVEARVQAAANSATAKEECAQTCQGSNFHFKLTKVSKPSEERRGKELLPFSGWSQAEMMLWADSAADRLLYSGQLPFDDPRALQASEQPLGSSEHIRGQIKKLLVKVIVSGFYYSFRDSFEMEKNTNN